MQQITSKGTKTVLISALNDLTVDQRLHKVAISLMKISLNPVLIGIRYRSSKKIETRVYSVIRLYMFCKGGPLFYAEFNIRLFFYLLFKRFSVLLANDLDTLPANYLTYRIRCIFSKHLKLVYDSHELFTELPELNGRPKTRFIWLIIERFILPKLKNTYTVCQSIADYYFAKYRIKMHVIRNMPLNIQTESLEALPEIKLPEGKKIILYQGALNIGRGLEQMLDIMPYIDNAIFIIAGGGDIQHILKQKVNQKRLNNSVIFTGKIPFEKLNQITARADVGLVLQEDMSLSYRYVLPNRLFDFIKTGIPMLASNLPEIAKIVESEKIGLLVNELNSAELLHKLKCLLTDEKLIQSIKSSLKDCSLKYYWEKDESILFQLFQNLK